MINVLEQYIAKPDDPVHNLSVELSRELETTFGYVLDPDHAEFCPEFVTATYLTPHFKFLIKPELKTVVVRYLKGKFIVYRIMFQTKIFIKVWLRVEKVPQQPRREPQNTVWMVMKGFSPSSPHLSMHLLMQKVSLFCVKYSTYFIEDKFRCFIDQ